jgi:hypothetical protein
MSFPDQFEDSVTSDAGEAEFTLRSELEEKEKLLWSARPRSHSGILPALPIVLFGIPWTLFSLFWTAAASGILDGFLPGQGARFAGEGPIQVGRIVFSVFGLPFILVGLFMLTAPFWQLRRLKHTVYGITDRRAIIITPSFRGSRTVESFYRGEIGRLIRHELRDGSGNLDFEVGAMISSPGGQRTSISEPKRTGFHGVARVKEVEDLLRRTLMTTT